ncbi:MAG: hypothetical protein H7222_01215 [Methylotenera sp.]|nr:hypothetical protein [Oligoflexia bacterium]
MTQPLPFLALIACGVTAIGINFSFSLLKAHAEHRPVQILKSYSPLQYRILSFGNLPATVDWFLIRFLGESSLEHVKAGTHSQVYYDLDLTTDLDPLFFELYHHGSNFLTVVHDDNLGAVAIAEKGLNFSRVGLAQFPPSFRSRYWSQPWQLSMVLVYLYLFEVKDVKLAAQTLNMVAMQSKAPAHMSFLSKRLQTIEGQYEVGFRILTFMRMSAETRGDQTVLEQMDVKLASLKASHFFYELNLKFQSAKTPLPKLQSQGLIPVTDPWGGKIYFDEAKKKITSTTPRDNVMGLE